MAENPDDVLHVEGGKPLNGTIKVRGAKNFVSKAMVAALLAPGKSVLKNVPEIRDVHVVSDLLRLHGVDVDVDGANGIVTIDASRVQLADVADVDTLSGSSRIPILFSGPLVHRLGEAFIPALGGCAIGGRPIDFHLETLRKLGATVDKEHKDGIHITAPNGLHGAKIHLPYPSVGATEQTLLAAVLAEGTTILENVAKEPHVVDVANFLNSMGANIRGAGTDVIKIRGVQRLHSTEYSVIPDQIEAGTFMFAAAATRGDVTVLNVIPKHLEATIAKLVEIGCEVEEFDDAVRVVSKGDLTSTHVKTLPYPGFPTDMQPQIGVTLALCKGTSIITESIFENRFKYLDELARMGANVKVEGNSATIEGVAEFSGARVSAPDLRAGAALCIAGLAADGITIVDDIVYIQRGYERFEEKLRSIGGIIERVDSEKAIQKFKLKVG